MLTSSQRARTELALKASFSKNGDTLVGEDSLSAAWAELIAKYAGKPAFGFAALLINHIRDEVSLLGDETGGTLQNSVLIGLCEDAQLAELVGRCAGGKYREYSDSWDFDRRKNSVRLEINADGVAEFARDAFPIA